MVTRLSSVFSSLVLGLVLSLYALQHVESQDVPPLTPPLPPPPPPPPPNQSSREPPPPLHRRKPPNGTGYGHHHPPPRQMHKHKMNTGKKIGLLFVGIAAILQIGVVGFLVFKRRQLMKIKDRYETWSSS